MSDRKNYGNDVDQDRPLILILTAAVGAGHEALGRAIQADLEAAGYRTEMVDGLRNLSAPLSRLFRWLYAFMILRATAAWAFSFWLFSYRPVFGASRLVLGAVFGRRLLTTIDCIQPALVVSTYPMVTAALGWNRGTGRLTVPALAVISDYGIHPLWVAPNVDLHIVPSEASVRSTDRSRYVMRVARIPVSPRFSHLRSDRTAARATLGISTDAFVVVISGGSLGMGDLGEAITGAVQAGSTVIAVTGHNEQRRQQLAQQFAGRSQVTILGWTDQMPTLIAAADCLIANAGGMTCLEAQAMGVPVVIFRPVPGHGRLNASVMVAAGDATWAKSSQELVALLARAASGEAPLRAATNESCLSFREAMASLLDSSVRSVHHERAEERGAALVESAGT